jgi:hypothetical protein
MSALTFNDKAHGYISHGKPWLKAKLHVYLRKGAVVEEEGEPKEVMA